MQSRLTDVSFTLSSALLHHCNVGVYSRSATPRRLALLFSAYERRLSVLCRGLTIQLLEQLAAWEARTEDICK